MRNWLYTNLDAQKVMSCGGSASADWASCIVRVGCEEFVRVLSLGSFPVLSCFSAFSGTYFSPAKSRQKPSVQTPLGLGEGTAQIALGDAHDVEAYSVEIESSGFERLEKCAVSDSFLCILSGPFADVSDFGFGQAEGFEEILMRFGCLSFKLLMPLVHVVFVHAGCTKDLDPGVFVHDAGFAFEFRRFEQVENGLLLLAQAIDFGVVADAF